MESERQRDRDCKVKESKKTRKMRIINRINDWSKKIEINLDVSKPTMKNVDEFSECNFIGAIY